MKKEKTVRTYQRRTKSGKMVTVHEHKASYDAAEEARKDAAKKAGAGSELASKKKAKEAGELPFTADEYKAWYHWDLENDPKNPTALKVKKALIAKLSPRGYKKYEDQMTDSWTARGHLKAFKGVGDVMKDSVDLRNSRKMAATHKAQAALADNLGAKDAAESFRKRSQEASARAKEIASRVKSRSIEEKSPKLTAAQSRLISIQDQTDKLPKSFGEFAGKRIESLMTDKGTFVAKFRREYPEFCKAYSAEYKRRRAEWEAKQAAKPTKRYKKDYELGPDGETHIVYKEVSSSKNTPVKKSSKNPLDVKVYKDGFAAGGTKDQWKKFLKQKRAEKKTPESLRAEADKIETLSARKNAIESGKKLTQLGFKKYTMDGITYYHKGSISGTYRKIDSKGNPVTVAPYEKESLKARVAKVMGKTYKPNSRLK